MLAAITVVLVVAFSVLITRVATVALTLTGLSRETARFQARSALSGAGFTTSESEAVVNHPVRRRIIMGLMLTGSAGIVTVVATAAIGFAGIESNVELTTTALTLVVGLGLLWWASNSTAVDRALQPLIHRLLRRYTDIDVRDYAGLLRVAGDYTIWELAVEPEDWLAGRDLGELRLNDEGVMVLGIQRVDGSGYDGTPQGSTTIHAGDTLILYGHADRIAELDERRAGVGGEHAHHQAVTKQQAEHEQPEPGEPEPAESEPAE